MSCPAWGTTCYACGLKNHWSRCCRKSLGPGRLTTPTTTRGRSLGRRVQQRVRQIDNDEQTDDSGSDNAYVYSVGKVSKDKQPMVTVTIQGLKFKLLVDSGANVNIIDEQKWSLMKDRPHASKAGEITNICIRLKATDANYWNV